jgi:uncharacterized membrane protein YGL010W
MKTLTDQLAQYAAYHRDPRNITTHFVGIPMIVLAVAVLLARPVWDVAGMAVSPAWAVSIAAVLYYLKLELRMGALMAVLMAINLWAAQWIALQSTTAWLASGVGLYVVGWAIQFLGHFYEGKKPAFVDDLVGLIIGPLFVVAEAVFAMGWRKDLLQAIEARVGPVHLRDLTAVS